MGPAGGGPLTGQVEVRLAKVIDYLPHSEVGGVGWRWVVVVYLFCPVLLSTWHYSRQYQIYSIYDLKLVLKDILILYINFYRMNNNNNRGILGYS